MEEQRGATLYAAYIKEQLAGQDARKASIEQRGTAVITSSGVIVSLLFGLVALLTGAEDYQLPDGAEPWLFAALVAFACAAIAAIITNAPLSYRGPTAAQMRGLVRGSTWEENVADAERRIAATNAGVLARAKSRNSFKGYVLLLAISAEVLAVFFLALATRVVIVHA